MKLKHGTQKVKISYFHFLMWCDYSLVSYILIYCSLESKLLAVYCVGSSELKKGVLYLLTVAQIT